MNTYSALALQMDCSAVNHLPDRAAVQQAMMSALERVDNLIAGSKGFISTFSGDTLKLVVLPEYFLTGHEVGVKLRLKGANRNVFAIRTGIGVVPGSTKICPPRTRLITNLTGVMHHSQ